MLLVTPQNFCTSSEFPLLARHAKVLFPVQRLWGGLCTLQDSGWRFSQGHGPAVPMGTLSKKKSTNLGGHGVRCRPFSTQATPKLITSTSIYKVSSLPDFGFVDIYAYNQHASAMPCVYLWLMDLTWTRGLAACRFQRSGPVNIWVDN